MKPRFLFLLLLVAPALAFAAEPGRIERDLGEGLAYVRVHALPADLPEGTAKRTAVVLDLRYTEAAEPGATALAAWLQFHSSVRTPVFLLVNSATAPAILDYLEQAGALTGVLTVGGASSRFVPDIPLKVSSATERTAYDAMEKGATLESLLADEPGKIRHDEASIAQEHAAPPDSVDNAGDSLVDAPEPAAVAPPPPRPLTDPTLQRAVHLHRTLRALRRI